MRTRLAIAIAAVALVAADLIHTGSETTPYTVNAVFDSAEGMVPGQLVKIAGARVGTVTHVTLQPSPTHPTARLTLSIDHRFAPFHADAACAILPEGLISENYVECNPGSSTQPRLQPATVTLSHTSVPVSLQDVLNIFALPTDERLGVLINELGIGTAGEGTNINAILRRADPALTQGDRVLSILDAQNTELADAVSQTSDVIGQLAGQRGAVSSFVSRAATVATTTAQHSPQLAQDVARLPAFLRALRGDLRPIDNVATDGTPLLTELHAAAPELLALTHTLPAFTTPGLTAVSALASAARTGLAAIPRLTPTIGQLSRFATTSAPVLPLIAKLLISTRDSGAFEGTLALAYRLGTDASLYDSTSHIISALIQTYPVCIEAPSTAGCDHAYDGPDQGAVPIDNPATAETTTTAAATARAGRSTPLNQLLGYLLAR